jgi:branched-chain amino acid transport system substrate-binding protein
MARSFRGARGIALAAAAALALTACAPDDEEEPEADEDVEVGEIAEDQLTFGQIAPLTGDLAWLGEPQVSALAYAVEVLNEQGGVLGNDVSLIDPKDEGGEAAVVQGAANELLREGVSAIIGAAASGMSMEIIDRITGNEVVQCSGSNTAPDFADHDAAGQYYFRTAPSDELQGPVLANRIVADGHTRVALAARADDYGTGLMAAIKDSLEEAGVEVLMDEAYAPETTDFTANAQQVIDADPDAFALVAFEEGTDFLRELLEADLGPDNIGVYSVDGMREAELASKVSPDDPSAMAGMRGTAPGGDLDFLSDLAEFDPNLAGFQFAAQIFDCAVLVALAAEKAGSANPADFAGEIIGLTQDGEDCSSFEECKALIDDGEDINYNGASGPLTFSDAGEPTAATMEIWEITDDGELETIDTEDVSFDDLEG